MRKIQNCVPCIKAENETSRFNLSRTISKALEVGKAKGYKVMVTGLTRKNGKEYYIFRPLEEGTQGLERIQYHTIL